VDSLDKSLLNNQLTKLGWQKL